MHEEDDDDDNDGEAPKEFRNFKRSTCGAADSYKIGVFDFVLQTNGFCCTKPLPPTEKNLPENLYIIFGPKIFREDPKKETKVNGVKIAVKHAKLHILRKHRINAAATDIVINFQHAFFYCTENALKFLFIG